MNERVCVCVRNFFEFSVLKPQILLKSFNGYKKNYVFAEIKPSFAQITINAFNERPLSFHNRI